MTAYYANGEIEVPGIYHRIKVRRSGLHEDQLMILFKIEDDPDAIWESIELTDDQALVLGRLLTNSNKITPYRNLEGEQLRRNREAWEAIFTVNQICGNNE